MINLPKAFKKITVKACKCEQPDFISMLLINPSTASKRYHFCCSQAHLPELAKESMSKQLQRQDDIPMAVNPNPCWGNHATEFSQKMGLEILKQNKALKELPVIPKSC